MRAMADLATRLVEALVDADYETIDKANWRECVGEEQLDAYESYVAELLPVVRELLAGEREVARAPFLSLAHRMRTEHRGEEWDAEGIADLIEDAATPVTR